MSKKFNIREWVLSVKYWSLLFIPHVSICLIFLIYTLVGASIIQEIESDDTRTTSSLSSSSLSSPDMTITTATAESIVTIKNLDRERERLLSKIIDKRQTVDLQQYTKYVNKHIREFEEEIKKTYRSPVVLPTVKAEKVINYDQHPRWTFSGAMYFIGTTLTTIGSNEFYPVTKIGKLFLMLYAAIGIPLTLVFLSDLSLLITRLIKYLSLLVLRLYSSKYFLSIRQWLIFRFIEKQLHISIPIQTEEEDMFSSKPTSPIQSSPIHYSSLDSDQSIERAPPRRRSLADHHHIQRLRHICNILIETLQSIDDSIELTIPQLLSTLIIYILIGAYLLSTNSYFDSIYICFTSLFSINLRNYYRHVTSQEHSTRLLFIVAIYLLFGLAIVSLCVKAVQSRIQLSLENLGKKVLRDLVEFLRQMGFHELSTDEILATTDVTPFSISMASTDPTLNRPQRLSRVSSMMTAEVPSTSIPNHNYRPVGVAEPLRRLSGSLIVRSTKNGVREVNTNTDKSVQVNTIIRSCGRCAGSGLSSSTSALSVKRHSAISASPSPTGDLSSGCEDEASSPTTLAPPNLDRLRQRRATLVAKTIINQMATQPSLSTNDEPVPSVVHLATHRTRPASESPPLSFKFSVNSAGSVSKSEPDTPKSATKNQAEFLEISKQISSLLAPSDDES